MIEYFCFKEPYINWLKCFLDNNNGFVRLYSNDYFKNITKEDDKNIKELFIFFQKLLRYSAIHNIASNVFEEEISNKYKDTYMCFDCSLVFRYKDTLINIVVLELGGASDMIIRTINNTNTILCKNIIDINDFYNWLNDYEYESINCSNCSNLIIINVDFEPPHLNYPR